MSKPTREAKLTPNREKLREIQKISFEFFQGKYNEEEALKKIKQIIG